MTVTHRRVPFVRARTLLSGFLVLLGILVCAGAPSAYAADRPNTMAGATVVSPLNTALAETLGSASDVDWFRFRTTTSGYARVLLTWMPADYRIRVYNSQGGLMTGSARPGRAFEEVYRHFPAGTYFVQVSSQTGGSSSTQPYRLKFAPLAEGQRLLSASQYKGPYGWSYVYMEALNNTALHRVYVSAWVRWYDAQGRVVADRSASVRHVAPRNRVALEVSEQVPSSAVRFTVLLEAADTTWRPFQGLVNQQGASYVDSRGDWFKPGQLKNTSGASAKNVRLALAMFDDGGIVRFVRQAEPENSTGIPGWAEIKAGATARYKFWYWPGGVPPYTWSAQYLTTDSVRPS